MEGLRLENLDRGALDEGLATVCRTALGPLDASRITVWRLDEEGRVVTPYLSITSDRDPADWPALPVIPIGDLPCYAAALDGTTSIVTGATRAEQVLLASTYAPSVRCRVLQHPRQVGMLTVEGADPAAGAPVLEVLAAAAGTWLETLAPEDAETDAADAALLQLLEAGVQACSPMEAAEALAAAAARALRLPTACAYLVDGAGIISEVATVGAGPGRNEELRASLIGRLAADSPVWRRAVEGPTPGPDLITDTRGAGRVRKNGVAQVLGLRSLAAIPLLSSDGPLGLVLCGDQAPRRYWRASDRARLGQLALEGTVVVDNARLRQAERYEASHDPLTGLLNRRAFSQEMDTALETAAAANDLVTVLVIDLDRFKQVNDQLGHQYGDELLTELAGRLRAALDDGDLLARMGGDEFAIALLSGRDGRPEEVAAGLYASIRRPVLLGSTPVQVTASIGMATFPGDGADLTGLLRAADLSMYVAKRAARPSGGHPRHPACGRDRDARLLDDLRTALDRDDQLVLYFQPKVNLSSGEITGVEALVRWRHPDLGLLGADRIVPPLEAAGLVTELSDWVVPRALDQLRRWDADGLELSMSVNVSADDLANDLVARVVRWLGQAGIPGHRLVTELTEGALLPEESRTLSVLEELRALGVETSIDDFGTGYSSLAYLAALPVDELKIDRGLLRDDPRHRRILRGIIGVGHELGARIVAEGVETVEDLRWLRAAGCDQAQGFLLGRPAPAATLIDVLRAESGAARTPRSRSSRP